MSDPVTIHTGDVLAGLAQIPVGTVQCCVTSPPYWGLRDYGVEGQIGLEATPDAFVAKMVEVFAAVRRVLRDDGTLWLNMGSSYASGGTSPTRSRLDVPACGSDGTPLQDSLGVGRACPCCGGELLDGSQIRRDYIARTSQQSEQSAPPHLPTSRDIARLDCEKASPQLSSRAAGKSTTRASFRRDRAAVVPAGKALVSPSTQPTSALCGPASVHTSVCTFDSATSVRPLGVGMWGTGLFCMACGYCTKAYPTFKPKDLINMPMMVAEALQADGWYLRSVIVWHKRSPMPESVTDRPTSSWEPIFLLAKSERYFYDAEAVKEGAATGAWEAMPPIGGVKHAGNNGNATYSGNQPANNGTRNQRNVWTLSAEPYPECHFATFPSEIPRRAIKAGTSEKGACPACGAPWTRVVEKWHENPGNRSTNGRKSATKDTGELGGCGYDVRLETRSKTTGWTPGCDCNAGDPVPCVVLDPFLGSGTTVATARELGRHGVGIELNPTYAELARVRIAKAERPHTYQNHVAAPAEGGLFA